MKRSITISISLALLLTVAMVFLLRAPREMKRASMPPQPEAIEEDPRDRDRQEWLQLRDPVTDEIPRGIRHTERAYAATLPRRDAVLAKSAQAGYKWRLVGPWNIGGRTRALAFDERSTNTLLAGGITGGVWRSTNRGATWTESTKPDQFPSVTCFAQDGRDSKQHIWYHGTGEFRTNSNRFGNVAWPGNGIFKSIDSGKSWMQLPSTADATPQALDNPFEYVNQIVTDRSNSAEDELYAACYGAIMRSTDGGGSWSTALGGFGNNVGFTSVAITRDGVLYAGFGSGGTVSGIWRSVDGVNWRSITPVGWADSCRRIILTIPPSNQNALYVLAETGGVGMQINGSFGFPEYYSLWRYDYLSGDGSGAGGSWSNRSTYLPQLGGPWNYNGLNSYTMHLTASPSDENDLFLGGTNLFRSTSGFTTTGDTRWVGGYNAQGQYEYEGALHPDQHVLLFWTGAINRIFAGTDGGVYETHQQELETGSPQWAPANNGFYTTQFYTVAIDPGTPGSTTVMGGMQDNGTVFSTAPDSSQPMTPIFGGDGSFCALRTGGETAIVSAQGSMMFRVRIDVAGIPYEYTRIDPEGGAGYLFINPFALDPSDDKILYNAGGRWLWRNSDIDGIPFDSTFKRATANWQRLDGTMVPQTISALGVSTESPRHRVYFGTTGGRLYRLDNANAGSPQHVEITGTNFPPGAYINCIAVDPLDGNRAMVVFTNYNVQSLYYTTDAGATWTAVGGNLEEHANGTGNGPSCRWGAIARHGNSTVVFVGTTTGLYSTTALDGSATVWSQEGASRFGQVRVDMIAARSSDGFVAVGTWGKGLYTTSISTLSVEAQPWIDPKAKPDLR